MCVREDNHVAKAVLIRSYPIILSSERLIWSATLGLHWSFLEFFHARADHTCIIENPAQSAQSEFREVSKESRLFGNMALLKGARGPGDGKPRGQDGNQRGRGGGGGRGQLSARGGVSKGRGGSRGRGRGEAYRKSLT